MPKVNVSLDQDVRDDLLRLVPPRKRSQVVNEALRKELLRRKHASATETLHRLRKKTATLTGRDVLAALRHDRASH